MTTAAVATATSPLWFATRATGLIALVLLTGTVVLGIMTSVRFASPAWPHLMATFGPTQHPILCRIRRLWCGADQREAEGRNNPQWVKLCFWFSIIEGFWFLSLVLSY